MDSRAQPSTTFDLRPLGAIFHVRTSGEETGGASYEMEWELSPESGGTPLHIHPEASESYEVLEGSLDLYVHGEWRTLAKGESLTVPRNVPHTFRNTSKSVTRVYNRHEPALGFDAYFRGLAELVERGIVDSPRPSPKAILHLAILMTSFPREIRSVRPPHGVLRILAAVGNALGYRVGASRVRNSVDGDRE